MDTARYLYSALANAIEARRNCDQAIPRNTVWFDKWTDYIEQLTELLPHGSGIDSGCKLDLDKSHANKLVIHTSFHHMNDTGMYDGWTDHTITVTPSFRGINLRISGSNRNQIKEYLHDLFSDFIKIDIPKIKML